MIQMKIKDESQLYDPLDPSGTRISDSIYSYLKSFCTEMEAEKHIHDTLQVISDGPVDADRLKRAIQGAVQKDRDEFDRLATFLCKIMGGFLCVSIAAFFLHLGGFPFPSVNAQFLDGYYSFNNYFLS